MGSMKISKQMGHEHSFMDKSRSSLMESAVAEGFRLVRRFFLPDQVSKLLLAAEALVSMPVEVELRLRLAICI
jgi:hypothetical protein